jgi:hypothetical protein
MPTKIAVLVLALAAPAAAAPPAHLEPLAFLAGSCWRGAFPDGKAEDEHCWEWLYDGKVLRDSHVVRSAKPDYAGQTLYAYDEAKKAVVYHYVTNQGILSAGTFEVTAEGIVFPERVTTPEGVKELRSVLTRAQDAYKIRSLEKVGGEWKELWSMQLRRVRSAP